jgi:small subunit ribosomal protein S11
MARQIQKNLPKKIKKKTPKGIVHIQASFNNTIITITTLKGEVISWCSSGVCGFKGARKGTPFAAKTAAATAAKQSIAQGMKQARVMVKGPGPGRETAIRGLQEAGLRVTIIRDITSIPHNGCRPPKKRRI